MLLFAAHFPNAAVSSPPVGHDGFGQGADQLPCFRRYPSLEQKKGVDGDDDLPEDVELKVPRGVVAYADGAGPAVPLQVVERVLLERMSWG